MKTGIRHVGIVVNDIEGAIAFWRDNFDFKVRIDQIEKGEFIERLLGIKSVCVRTVKLLGEGNVEIELLNFCHINRQKLDKKSVTDNGITHIALNIKNLESRISRLEEMGYQTVNAPEISVDSKVRVCYLEGFEGVFLELVEML